MKVLKSTILFCALLFAFQSGAAASGTPSRDKALTLYKNYVNKMVQRVEKAKTPEKKREILNDTFDDMISAFNTASDMVLVAPKDRKALAEFKANIQEKKNELNGAEGYQRVPNGKLSNFAHYVQQDLEQADTVTITISATLLVLIIILLLLL